MSDATFEVGYQLTPGEYTRVQRYSCWRKFRWLAIATALLFPIGLYQAVSNGNYNNLALIWSVLMAVYIVLFFQIFLPRRSRRVFNESKSLQAEHCMKLSTAQAEFINEYGVFRLPWQDVHKWNEYVDIFVIYVSSVMVVMVPKRVDDGEILAFAKARLVESGLVKPGKARRT